MSWSDTALMLSVARKSETQLLLNLLTENHGRRSCSLTLEPSDIQLLLPGCELDITGQVTGTAGLVDVEIKAVTHGIIAEDPEVTSILVVRHINEALTHLLAPSEPYQNLYAASVELVRSMEIEDPRWPIQFVQWEISMLDALGHMQRFKRCKPDYRHGEAIYMSRQTGKVVSRAEAGAFIDRLEPVPSLIMGAQNGSVEDVQRAFSTLNMIFEDFVFPAQSSDRILETREEIAKKIQALSHIPTPQAAPKGNFLGEEQRKKRRLAMRPLTIGGRSLTIA